MIKNVIAFCGAALIFLAVSVGVLFIIKSEGSDATELFGFDGDNGFVILGKTIEADESVSEKVRDHLKLCKTASGMVFPKFLSAPAKETATLLGATVLGIVSDIYTVLSDFVYGNM